MDTKESLNVREIFHALARLLERPSKPPFHTRLYPTPVEMQDECAGPVDVRGRSGPDPQVQRATLGAPRAPRQLSARPLGHSKQTLWFELVVQAWLQRQREAQLAWTSPNPGLHQPELPPAVKPQASNALPVAEGGLATESPLA